MNPDIEYHKLAESMGWWAKGPIKDPAELGAGDQGGGRGGEVRPARAGQRLDAAALMGRTVDAFCSCKWAGGARRRPACSAAAARAAASAEKGKTAFVQYGCWQCHGFQGQGGGHRPASWRRSRCRWRRSRPSCATSNRAMPPYSEAILSNEDLADIHAYLAAIPRRRTTRAFRCSTSRAARSKIDRPGLLPGRCFSAPAARKCSSGFRDRAPAGRSCSRRSRS